MANEYWITIDALLKFVKDGKVDANTLKNATFRLRKELDRRLVYKLPPGETNRLISALNGLYGEMGGNE